MGVIDKFLGAMKLNGMEDEDYGEGYLDDEDDMEPAPRKSSKIKDIDDYDDTGYSKKTANTNKITPINKPAARRGNTAGSGMEVCVIKPTVFDDAKEITQTLLANRTVVLNLEGLDVDLAQRIIDFASGSCYAIDGNLQKISHYIFIITPASVDISGDFQGILGDSFEMPLNN